MVRNSGASFCLFAIVNEDYYPRFCVYSIVNRFAGTTLVRFVFVDLFPFYFIRWNLIEQQLVNLILQTSLDCYLY